MMKQNVAVYVLFGFIAFISSRIHHAVAQETTSNDKNFMYLLETYTYKKVGDLEIKADVHRYAERNIGPAIIWIHGGALVYGSRKNLPPSRQFRRYLESGYTIVSIDYRLAPETKLPYIIEDVEDAYSWVYNKGPELFNIDPERIFVMGASAGGYLALVSGYRVNPLPKAVVSLYVKLGSDERFTV